MQYRRLCVSLAVVMFSACTFSEPRLRPEPVASVPIPGNVFTRSSMYGMFKGGGRNVGMSKSLNGMQFRCAEWRSWNSTIYDSIGAFFTGTTPSGDECIYVTVDPSTLPLNVYGKIDSQAVTADVDIGTSPPDKPERNPVELIEDTHILLAASDYNCDNFLARAFAAKTNTGFFSSVFSSILSAAGTVLTPAAGIPLLVPTSLQAGNSAITGGTAAFDANYYASKSFDIMETGISAARKQRRAEIYARLCVTDDRPSQECDIPATDHYEGYRARPYLDMAEVLSDITSYDRVCSIEGGLKELSGAAAAKQEKADEAAGIGPAGTSTPSATATPTATPTPTPAPHKKPHGHRTPTP